MLNVSTQGDVSFVHHCVLEVLIVLLMFQCKTWYIETGADHTNLVGYLVIFKTSISPIVSYC